MILVPGMRESTQKTREELGITEHCTECSNCGLCVKSHLYQQRTADYTLSCRHRILCKEGMTCAAHSADGRAFACYVKTQEDFDNLEYKCDRQYEPESSL